MVHVWMGRIGEGGSSEVNTTCKSADTLIGKLLPASKQIVFSHKYDAGDIRFRRWKLVTEDAYKRRYLDVLRQNFAANCKLFRDLLERDDITLTCYCRKHKPFCHRTILAQYVASALCPIFRHRLHLHGRTLIPALCQ